MTLNSWFFQPPIPGAESAGVSLFIFLKMHIIHLLSVVSWTYFKHLFILLSYITSWLQSQPPPQPLPTSPLPQIHSSIFLQRSAGPPGISAKHGITSYKTRHKPWYPGWMRQPSRRTVVPKAAKRVRDCPCSHCPTRGRSYTTIT